MAEEEDGILLTVLNENTSNKSMFGTIIGTKTLSLPLQTIANSLQKTVSNLAKILDSIDTEGTSFKVDTVAFNLGIEASGKVSLIGEIGASNNSSICVTLKRKKNDEISHV